MDFIPFNTPAKDTKAHNGKHSTPQNSSNKSSQKKPAFGSPALSFGSPAVGFGSPAQGFGTPAQNFNMSGQSFGSSSKGQNSMTSPVSKHSYTSPPAQNQWNSSPRHQQRTPRGGYGHSPRGHNHSPRGSYPSQSPRHQLYTPSPLTNKSTSFQSFDSNNFKTPQQFSPSRGRGNMRKSYSTPYSQNSSRNDPNLNIGGSSNLEDYYHPSMVQDPWRFLVPVIANKT